MKTFKKVHEIFLELKKCLQKKLLQSGLHVQTPSKVLQQMDDGFEMNMF